MFELIEKDFYTAAHRDYGHKIIIIIDDFYKVSLNFCEEYIPQGFVDSLYAQGFYEIWQHASNCTDVKAIAFFNLPNEINVSIFDDLYNKISQWVNSLSDVENFSCYYLIDSYYGYGSDPLLVGIDLAEYIVSKVDTGSSKVAFITMGGNQDNVRFMCFEKRILSTHFKVHDVLPSDFLRWLDFKSSPLVTLWDNTSDWFESSIVIPHNSPQLSTKYREDLIGKLTFSEQDIPLNWLANDISRDLFHESVKHFCGGYFCGIANRPGSKAATIGSVYIIALMVHKELFDNINLLTENIEWQNHPYVNSNFLPIQSLRRAKKSHIAIYNLLRCLFENNSYPGMSHVEKLFFDDGGKKLKIVLNWSPINLANKVEEAVCHIEDKSNIDTILKGVNTRSAILNVWLNMLSGEDGFMSPGSIFLKSGGDGKSILTIASLE
jgi:hypothetical protein